MNRTEIIEVVTFSMGGGLCLDGMFMYEDRGGGGGPKKPRNRSDDNAQVQNTFRGTVIMDHYSRRDQVR